MTVTRQIAADWAVYSKKPGDRLDYRVLACCAGPDFRDEYTRVFQDLNPGNITTERSDAQDAPPHIVVGQSFLDSNVGFNRAVMVREWSENRDIGKRLIARSRLYILPSFDVDEGRIPLRTFAEAVAGPRAPALSAHRERHPIELDLGPESERVRRVPGPELEWLVWAAAAALAQPVVIVGATNLAWTARLDVLDAILELLPAGMRPRVWASTWTEAAGAHRIRLSFGLSAGAGRLTLVWGKRPDPDSLHPSVVALASDMLDLADRLNGPARITELFDAMDRPAPFGDLAESIRYIREGLRQLDQIRHAAQEVRDGHGDPEVIGAALASDPQGWNADERQQIDDLIDALLTMYGDDGIRILMDGSHWERGWQRGMSLIAHELERSPSSQASAPSDTALRMWPVVRRDGRIDEFLAALIDLASADRSGTSLRRLVDFWVEITHDIPDSDLMPMTLEQARAHQHFVTVLLGVRDRSDPGSWIKCWLNWLRCGEDGSPGWLRAYAVLLDFTGPAANDAYAALRNQDAEGQLTVLLSACRAREVERVFATVWPTLSSVAESAVTSARNGKTGRHRQSRVRNRLESVLADDAYFLDATAETKARVDTLRVLLGKTALQWTGVVDEKDQATYLAALGREWSAKSLVRHLATMAERLADHALVQYLSDAQLAVPVLNWLVIGLGAQNPDVTRAVASAVQHRPAALRSLAAGSAFADAWWDGLLRAAPDIRPDVFLERLAIAAEHEHPVPQIAQLWAKAVGEGCAVRDIMVRLDQWADRGGSQRVFELLKALAPGEFPTDIFTLIAEQVWGPRLAATVTEDVLATINTRLQEIKNEEGELKRREKALKSARKRGQRSPAAPRARSAQLPVLRPSSKPGTVRSEDLDSARLISVEEYLDANLANGHVSAAPSENQRGILGRLVAGAGSFFAQGDRDTGEPHE